MIKDLLRFFGVVAIVLLACLPRFWRTHAGRDSETKYALSPPAVSAVAQTASTDAAMLQAGSNDPATGATTKASAKSPSADSIVAKVNGETITYGEIRAGIGEEMLGFMVAEAIPRRRDLLLNLVAVRQYLTEQGVKVAREDVDREVARLRLTPPASGGCPCCSYVSLDAFLASNFITVNDLRHAIYNDIGMHQHVTSLWNTSFPPGRKA